MKTSESKLKSAREWKAKNPERIKQLDYERYHSIRSDPAKWEEKKAYQRAYNKRHRDKNRSYDRSRDKSKITARNALRQKVRSGIIQRKPCEVCGSPNADAHHYDYKKPLEVRWLCRQHHADEHNHK